MFKDLRNGSPVYILDRKEITVTQGTLTNTPMSRFDTRIGTQKMVVDLDVEISGSKTSYVVEDSVSASYFGDKVITCDKQSIYSELEAIKANSEAAVKMHTYHQQAIPKCEALMREYSDQYRERTETQQRMDSMESQLKEISATLKSLTQSLN